MQDTLCPQSLQDLTRRFRFEPFGSMLRPYVKEALHEVGKDRVREGTKLIPLFMVWFVLAMTLRRDLSLTAVLEWMVSATRWLNLNLAVELVAEGALTHARVALGYPVMQLILQKWVAHQQLTPDFHRWITLIFDGTLLSMPDIESNRKTFGKPSCQHGSAAFPHLRLVALLVGATHVVVDLAYAAYSGKGTGERTLMQQILERLPWRGVLLLFDAGFYSFALAYTIHFRREAFLMKISSSVKCTPLPGYRYADGSYLARIRGRVNGKVREMVVRVVEFHLRGFRPSRLITNLFDESISARELVRHYHKRWEVEIAFDEIKTHQCATLRGHAPTVLRSKRSDLVQQELYALMISYNALRVLMQQGAYRQKRDPLSLSFLESLQAVIDALPILNWSEHPRRKKALKYLRAVLGGLNVERPRRPRSNPRVVKLKWSKFKRKSHRHRGTSTDFDKDLSILMPLGDDDATLRRTA
jgi:hypothetical protein